MEKVKAYACLLAAGYSEQWWFSDENSPVYFVYQTIKWCHCHLIYSEFWTSFIQECWPR